MNTQQSCRESSGTLCELLYWLCRLKLASPPSLLRSFLPTFSERSYQLFPSFPIQRSPVGRLPPFCWLDTHPRGIRETGRGYCLPPTDSPKWEECICRHACGKEFLALYSVTKNSHHPQLSQYVMYLLPGCLWHALAIVLQSGSARQPEWPAICENNPGGFQ